MERISVVIPVYSNSSVLPELYQRLTSTLEQCTWGYEIILVDDRSVDSSWQQIADFAADDQRVRAIRLSRNFGQHAALCAGFQQARGDIIIMMDADLEDPPEEIPRFVELLKPGSNEHGDQSVHDIVFSVREGERKAWHRELTSRLYHRLFAALTGNNVPSHIGTMRGFNRQVLDALLQHGERNVLYGPLIMQLGYRQTVISVEYHANQIQSSYSLRKRVKLAVQSLLTYSDIPVRLLTNCGLIATLGSMLYFVMVIGSYIINGRMVAEGVTIVIVLLCLATGVTSLGLGIIGNYVFQMYQEVLRRPRYLIAESINVDSPRPDNSDTHAVNNGVHPVDSYPTDIH